MNSSLQVYNSLSGKKELFKALDAPNVGMYVCGPTVYSEVHLGNCRTFISFDMIFRYLTYLGYKVRYVRNITDAGHLENDADEGEDKISKKARLNQVEPMEIVQKYAINFHEVMRLFNSLPPSIEPTATGHIIEQISMAEQILNDGLAYESNGSIYFDVNAYNNKFDNSYGELSGRKIEDLLSNTRELDGQSEKRNPADFALWKKASPMHIMRWKSPWSNGFPGWHLECSVMSSKYLGEQFDIHGGGMDLKFPHHECEIAQNKASHGSKSPVSYWLHTNMLTLNGQRMSKSTGNTLLPGELFTGNNDKLEKAFSPMVVRFFMLQAHYRSSLDFSSDALEAAEKGFTRLMKAEAALSDLPISEATSSFDLNNWTEKMHAAMNDDFNSPMVISHLFDAVKFINSVKNDKAQISSDEAEILTRVFRGFVFDVLGLQQEMVDADQTNDALVNDLMKIIMDSRQRARQTRDFESADRIRDLLGRINITIKDTKDATNWEINK